MGIVLDKAALADQNFTMQFTQAAMIEGDAELLTLFAKNLNQLSAESGFFNIVEP